MYVKATTLKLVGLNIPKPGLEFPKPGLELGIRVILLR